MTSIPIRTAWRPYLRALAGIGLDVLTVGAWVAAAELPRGRRRLARTTLAAVTVASGIPGARTASAAIEPMTPGARSGLPYVDAGIRVPAGRPLAAGTSPRRRAVLAGAVVTTAVAASAGGVAAGRQLERRWLARLVRHGHPHPHRALGVRMAAVYAVLVVPSRLLAVRKAARWPAGDGAAVPERSEEPGEG